MNSGYAARVEALVEAIPPGLVLSYGDIAEILEAGGPRQVAAVMAAGSPRALPWWRVVRADGSLPERLAAEALAEYRVEGTALRGAGRRVVDMARARWTPGDAELSAHRESPGGSGDA